MTAIGREAMADRSGLATDGADAAGDRSGLTDQIIAEFRAFFRELRCMGSDRMRRGGMSSAHFHLLTMLDRHGEMAMGRIADVLDVSLSNASGLIDRLAERGFVERIRVPDDRRVVLVALTPHGRRTLSEIEVLKEEMLTRVLGALDLTQLKRLTRSLRDIEAAAKAVLADDPDWVEHSQLPAHAQTHGVESRHHHQESVEPAMTEGRA
jgi:DNA-binding MarR family transcriptional regulator